MGELSGANVLVTGGSGFIASHLVHRLLDEGAEVAVLTKYDSIVDNIRLADVWNDVRHVEADLRNIDSLTRQMGSLEPEIVYHFAAYNHVGDSFMHVSEAVDVNARGTSNLMEAYEDYSRFIYISTSEVYGYQDEVPFREDMAPFPISPYSVGKYAGELYARMKHHVYGRPVVVLRPFNAFGPYQSPRAVIGELVLKCVTGEAIATTKGEQTRDFNYVADLVDGFVLAGTADGAVGEVINIGSGEEITIERLVRTVHELSGSSSELGIGELPYRPTEIWRMYADNRKAADILGWSPAVGFEDGLRRTVEWFREFEHAVLDPGSAVAKLCRG